MNRAIAGYFDNAHRGLTKISSSVKIAPGPSARLPPLRPELDQRGGLSDDAGCADAERDINGWEKVMGHSLGESKSMGSLEFLAEYASQGAQSEQCQQTIQENSKLHRKVRALQDHLAITSAKKDAFQAQAQRLEREFKKGRDQSDQLQKDLLDARQDVAQLGKGAQEAISMMSEMRKTHITEIKLLQRGLAARGSQEHMRNRVNEMADLVDKVGRAVVQRDEAIRDKTQMEGMMNKALKDLRSSNDEVFRLKKQNKHLSEKLKESKRKGHGSVTPAQVSAQVEFDSDDEFERDLQTFEKRFEILEEGPAGLDVLASNLAKDKQELEKRCASLSESIKSFNVTVDNWKYLGAEKDQQIKDLGIKIENMIRSRSLMEEQIDQKQREIALQVEEEKASLLARVNELEMVCDNARSDADGMEKASNRLSKELVKVQDQYPGAAAPAEGEVKQDTAAEGEDPQDGAPAGGPAAGATSGDLGEGGGDTEVSQDGAPTGDPAAGATSA